MYASRFTLHRHRDTTMQGTLAYERMTSHRDISAAILPWIHYRISAQKVDYIKLIKER